MTTPPSPPGSGCRSAHQQSHGILEPADVEPAVPEGFSIRDPELADVEQLIELDVALPRHQRLSPVFSGLDPPSPDEARAEWESTLADDKEHVLIGYHGDRPVSCSRWSTGRTRATHDGLMQADAASYLAFAVTLPDARGSGIGRAVTEASLAWAAREGYRVVVTDWRETNLLASRFWPSRGFRRSFLRLYRSIP